MGFKIGLYYPKNNRIRNLKTIGAANKLDCDFILVNHDNHFMMLKCTENLNYSYRQCILLYSKSVKENIYSEK